MKINIYYGGRGLLDDPTLYVISRIENVLKELRVKVERYNIYEHKNEIATLPQTFRDVDGIILATTVEWLGIGGYMQQFLDACWLYGDKEKISNTYMQPIVMSTTYGEREAETTLCNAWEILGGLPWFFDKAAEHLVSGGIIVMYSNEIGFVKKQIRLRVEYRLLQETCILDKNDFYLFVIRYED